MISVFGKEHVDSKVRAYAVFDTKAQLHTFPHPAISDAVAIRQFGEIANNKNHAIGKHPEDYVLYFVGFYNETKGTFENVDKPVSLVNASGLVSLDV